MSAGRNVDMGRLEGALSILILEEQKMTVKDPPIKIKTRVSYDENAKILGGVEVQNLRNTS